MSYLCKNLKQFSNILNVTRDGCVRFFAANSNPPKGGKLGAKSTLKLSFLGLGLGALVGTGYSIHNLNKPKAHIINEETIIPLLKQTPNVEPTKYVRHVGDDSGLKLTLYQYQTCPFCCKVRAFLDYYGISYNLIEVDPVLRQAVKWSDYKKVPILLAQVKGGVQPLNDSSMIVSALSTFLNNPTAKDLPDIVKCYPLIKFYDEGGVVRNEVMNKYFLMLDPQNNKRTIEDTNEERKWRKWADDVLVHMLSPNVYRTREEALQAFNWFSEVGEWEVHFPAWERYLMIYVGAFAMFLIGKRLKARHHLKNDVRQSLYDECNVFTKAINTKGTPFIGGNEPNLADLAVYGVMNSIEGCDAFRDVMKKNCKMRSWYTAMKLEVQNHRGSNYA